MTRSRSVAIPTGSLRLEGDLSIPDDARGLVIFAHGSGSSRHSRRNRAVAATLQLRGLATLLLDLLTVEEEAVDSRTSQLRFDIPLLAGRLALACHWAVEDGETAHLPVGLFGASTGGGAALIAAAHEPDTVSAVVSRGGRPDLAGAELPHVRAPTLLIVGALDDVVLRLNREAQAQMVAPVRLSIIPGATHLFEEPGAIEQVAALARDWFSEHLAGS